MRRSDWGPPEKDPRKRAPRWRPTSTLWHNLAGHAVKAVARHRSCLRHTQASPDAAAEVTVAESRLGARMRDQHSAVQALAARGLGIRAIARELGVDRKTARRFTQALTGDDAVARAVCRPAVLDRYQPHLHRRWNEGCQLCAASRQYEQAHQAGIYTDDGRGSDQPAGRKPYGSADSEPHMNSRWSTTRLHADGLSWG